jgi:hypothetical protein
MTLLTILGGAGTQSSDVEGDVSLRDYTIYAVNLRDYTIYAVSVSDSTIYAVSLTDREST